MKTLLTTLLVGIATLGIVFPWNTALAYDPYNPYYTYPPYQQPVTYNPEQAALLQQLLQLIQQLQMQLQNQGGTYYPPVYGGGNYTFYPTDGYNNNSYKEKPEVETEDADDEDHDSAELNGNVDMRDFDDGIVFFVYGQDEDMIEDVEKDYDEYDEVKDDEDGQDFMVVRVDRDLDGEDDYSEEVDDLDYDERYYFTICVEYDDEDGDETLECGKIEDFRTD